MSGIVVVAEVGPQVIDVAALARGVESAAVGAVVTFTGIVRDHDAGRSVTALDYEAHPAAATTIASIGAEIVALAGVDAVALQHRTGLLRVGDVAFAAALAAAHRRDAFAACERAVEEVKARLEIWKRQEFADGSEEWVNAL